MGLCPPEGLRAHSKLPHGQYLRAFQQVGLCLTYLSNFIDWMIFFFLFVHIYSCSIWKIVMDVMCNDGADAEESNCSFIENGQQAR